MPGKVVANPVTMWDRAIQAPFRTVAELGSFIPATFLHELQHLIFYSQHVVIGGGAEGASWLDEGLSIVAEELGSLYYEQKCPPPQCRTRSSQVFPDSSQGFVQDFLYDSYQYALLPDTANITLGDDGLNGFSWRGGAWLLTRWLGDHAGAGIFKKLEREAAARPRRPGSSSRRRGPHGSGAAGKPAARLLRIDILYEATIASYRLSIRKPWPRPICCKAPSTC